MLEGERRGKNTKRKFRKAKKITHTRKQRTSERNTNAHGAHNSSTHSLTQSLIQSLVQAGALRDAARLALGLAR